MTAHSLNNIQVLDLTNFIAGPYCTKLLAGFGADVVKVERPISGDPLRAAGPFHDNAEGLEKSIPFLWLNTGKKSITLDLKKQRGVAILRGLAAKADLLVESFSPRIMAELGLDYETLRESNPGLIMTSISNFGNAGPYRDYEAEEITEYAMSGCMHLTGDPERPPLASGPAVAQYTAGMWAYTATLAALFQRGDANDGRHIDLSIQECAMDNIEVALVEQLQLGKTPKRKNDKHAMVPWELYPCRDGEVAVIGGPIRHWLKGAELFEEPRLLDKKFEHALGRIEHREEFNKLIQPWLDAHDKEEVFRAGQERKMAFGYRAGLQETLSSPQHESREFFVDVDHPQVGKHRYCGAPFRLSETPWRSDRAPLLGEHTDSVLGDKLGYSTADLTSLHEERVI